MAYNEFEWVCPCTTKERFPDQPHACVSHTKRGRKVPCLPSSSCIFRKTSIYCEIVSGRGGEVGRQEKRYLADHAVVHSV